MDAEAGKNMDTVVTTLAAYGASETLSSDEVRHHAKRALIDWFAALLPGSRLPPATSLAEALRDEIGLGRGATVYVSGRYAPLRTAALINATASHTIEFDDIFRDAVYHPGCPVIGAALAAAQARKVDGLALLRGIVIGYEISTRIGVAVQPSHYRFWHTTGTIGTFGAAAAVAGILNLDATRMAHGLATAGTFAAALQQAFRSDAMSKPLHAGHAADAGALASLAAEQGVTGALDILEGPAGFGAAMSEGPDWSRATEALASRYNIAAMTFKNHGCCGHSFAAIDAALTLQREHAIPVEAIDRIDVGTYKAAVDITGRHKVATPFEARFSTPYTLSTALVHGSVRLDATTPERLADRHVQALMQRVSMHVDTQCEMAFPSRRSALVEIALRDGQRFSHYQPTRKGDPDAPLSDAELAEKFRELASPVIGSDTSKHLLETLWSLDHGSVDLGALHLDAVSQAVEAA